MIQLRKAGLVADREDVERLRIEFEKNHFALLRDLFDSHLLSLILSYLEQSPWMKCVEAGFYSDSELELGTGVELVHFMANVPSFLKTISEITGYNLLTWFEGRIYRMEPNIGHKDNWHSDDTDDRLIAMSVNLSPRGYQGGLLQMREAQSHRMLAEITNTGLGDAILFRISKDFQHRVTEVQGGEPKTAFAGWFFATKQSWRERLSSRESAWRVR